jgi:hypothetical protein
MAWRGTGALARLGWLCIALLGSAAAAEPPAPASARALPDVAAPAVATPPGVFYDRYEPTFYTGFAPRSLDPQRVHVQLGRGNQVRVTAVLADDVLESYASDLEARHRTIRSLIDAGDVRPTQNEAFSAFESALRSAGVDAAADGAAAPGPRERNLALLERLEPDRVRRIRIPVDALVSRWVEVATSGGAASERAPAARGALLDAMLPTRVFADPERIEPETARALDALVADAKGLVASRAPGAAAALRDAWLRLFEHVTRGHYPVRGDALEFVEFTALYPIGTANEFTVYEGRRIPLSPTPGRRRLTTHQRSGTIDHIADVPTYSFSPWIPYMHVGPKLHNAFHTPYWQLAPRRAAFLPDALRDDVPVGPEGRPYQYAYYLSRGPASHGCTHVNPGHLVELRQLLPYEPEALAQVEVFINPSHLFDVFDVDGDLAPEVMGVGYFVAYSIVNDRPGRLYAPTERGAFYDWLYGGELELDAGGRASFAGIRDARFAGARAVDGRVYDRLPLYEAPYAPERIQFYAPKPIPFVRELRNVGAHRAFSRERAASARAL